MKPDPSPETPRRALVPFFALASLFVLAPLALIALATRFDFGALGFHGVAALAIGVAATTGLGVGLMALVFHSSRAGHDDDAPNVGPDGR